MNMNKLCAFLFFCSIFLFASSPSIAIEKYISDSMPSDDWIIKNVEESSFFDKVHEIVGKQQISENSWNIFFKYSTMDFGPLLGSGLRLIKLDNKIWIIEIDEIDRDPRNRRIQIIHKGF